jgi:vWA-MoxR associated protein middle region 0/Effector-associated domain 2
VRGWAALVTKPGQSVVSTQTRLKFRLVATLETVPHLWALQSQIVPLIEGELGYSMLLSEHVAAKGFALELVFQCARFPTGLPVLAEVVNGVATGSREAERFNRLVDEWAALATVPELEPIWTVLNDALAPLPAEQSAMLYVQAAGPRSMDLPKWCSSVWSTFVRLVGRNAAPNGNPPWLSFLALVRDQVDAELGTQIDKGLAEIFARWQAPALLNQARTAATSPRVSIRRFLPSHRTGKPTRLKNPRTLSPRTPSHWTPSSQTSSTQTPSTWTSSTQTPGTRR